MNTDKIYEVLNVLKGMAVADANLVLSQCQKYIANLSVFNPSEEQLKR